MEEGGFTGSCCCRSPGRVLLVIMEKPVEDSVCQSIRKSLRFKINSKEGKKVFS